MNGSRELLGLDEKFTLPLAWLLFPYAILTLHVEKHKLTKEEKTTLVQPVVLFVLMLIATGVIVAIAVSTYFRTENKLVFELIMFLGGVIDSALIVVALGSALCTFIKCCVIKSKTRRKTAHIPLLYQISQLFTLGCRDY